MPNYPIFAEQNSNSNCQTLACLSGHKLLQFDYLVVVGIIGNPNMKKMNMKSMSTI